MKDGIHPTYYKDATIKCACGAIYLVGSTEKELSVEICSACHPFYTGKQKLVDTAGRVDKFKARIEAASKAKAKKDASKVAPTLQSESRPESVGKVVKAPEAKKETKHKVIKDDKKFDK